MSDKVPPEDMQLALCKAYVLADKLGCLDAVWEVADSSVVEHQDLCTKRLQSQHQSAKQW
jgi:hypothetical protein